MKKNSKVVQEWLSGKNSKSRNLFSEDGVIYSYGHHFPIAKLGNPVIITSRTYSSSTGRHVGIVQRALSEHYRKYIIAPPDCGIEFCKNKFIEFYEQMIQKLLSSHLRSRTLKFYYNSKIKMFQDMIELIQKMN
ncbi:MAG: hypothetical protein M0P71_00970 [Melioribacteraceae bacterium]|nr:hypothetical protein [Melioribacteraceae bacterium]